MSHKSCGWLRAAFAACLISTMALAQAEPALVARYDFTEGAGTVLEDRSGNGNNGTIYGAQWVRQGKRYALSFNGVNNWVNVPPSKSLSSIARSGTVAFWYRIPKEAVFPGIMAIEPTGANVTDMPLMLFVRNDEKVFAYVSDGKKYNSVATDAVRDRWAHFAFTWNGASIKGYANGALIMEEPCAYGPEAAVNRALWIGRTLCTSPGCTPYFKGDLGEVAIYSEALDGEAILRHYKSGIDHFSSAPSAIEKDAGPILRYDFDEGQGAVAKDKSGNGLDGRIIGAKYVTREGGHALEFDGNSCVLVPKSPLLNVLGKPGRSYSIEFRFKSPGGANQSLTEKWPTSSVPYPWAIRGPYPDGSIKFAVYDAKTNNGGEVSYTHPAMKDNQWHHLAAVRDMEGGTLRIYVDGVPGGSGADVLKATDISNDGPVCLGARSYSTGVDYGGMIGQLDDVRIYARALTLEEVKTHVGMTGLPLHRDIESADAIEKFEPVMPVATLRVGAMVVKTGAAGAVQIDAGSDSYVVESCFSYPGKDNKIGWNGLPRKLEQPQYPSVEFQSGAEAGWKPTVKQLSADTISVEAQGSGYRLRRTITVRAGKVDFVDEMTSLGKEPTGVVVRHGITADKDFLERYNPGLEVPANPTVFLRGPQHSVALVMNDDVSRHRIRAALGASKNHSGVQIQRFALDAGKSYTFSWSVYVMNEGQGYFDFINRVRNDWNANVTVDGPWGWAFLLPEGDDIKFYLLYGKQEFYVNRVLKDPAEMRRLADYLQWRGIKLLGVAPWLDHDPGAMTYVPTWEEWKQIMRQFLPAVRKAAPQLRVLAEIETDWISFRRENIKNSDRIPIADRTKRGGPDLDIMLEPDVSQLIEDSFPAWKDSWVRDSEGRLMIHTYHRGMKAIEQPPVCVFPEVGNKRYDYLMQQIDLAIDEVGMDGVYLDEFPLGQNGFRRTYGGPWDGISAEMDFHTGRIYGQYKDCGLAGVQARVNVMNHVLSKGKIFVANRQSTTCAEQSLPAFRFTETGGAVAESAAACRPGEKPPLSEYLLWTVLNTPIGLGTGDLPAGEELPRWIMRGLIVYLRHGMLFYYGDSGPAEPPMTEAGSGALQCIREMYPITLVELGEGFIVGKEKILSAVSLERPWSKPGEPTVLLFDISGRQMDSAGRYEVTTVNGDRRIKLTLKDWAEVAIVK